MRQAASLRDGILPSAAGTLVWSFVIVLLLAAGSPPLQACDGGTAVPDPESNPGLAADCTVLLGLRDELASNGSLNWDIELVITDWQGISVSGSPRRVTELNLFNNQLTGPIPPELGQLSQLTFLDLTGTGLTGEIPEGSGADRIVGAIRPGVRRGDAAYAAMT